MSTALATTTKPSALALMASRVSVDPAKLHQTLKATVFKGATDEELLALVVVANTYNLNPLLKELYAFPAKGGGIVPVVSIDGWISMVNNHPQMDGVEFQDHRADDGKLEAITCIIYRKDRGRPIKVTEYLSECRRNTDPWKMENRMLRHKALIQCARVAFGFSGVTDEDEGEDMRDVTPRPAATTVKANPFKGDAPAIDAPSNMTASQAIKAEAATVDRDGLAKNIAAGIKESGRKNSEAFAIFTQAGLMTTAKMSDATDDQLVAIASRLDLLEKPAPAEQPDPQAKEQPDTSDKTPAQRKDDALAAIEEQLLGFDGIDLNKFAAMCREQKLIGGTQALRALDHEKLENIAGSVAFIIKTATEGTAQ